MSQIRIKLVRSRIGTTPYQRKCLDALGLKRLQKSRAFNDTPAIRGIVRKIPHLLEVCEEAAIVEQRGAKDAAA